MAINWALGNPDAPFETAEAFRLGGERQARKSALSMYSTDPAAAERSALATGDPAFAGAVRGFRGEDEEKQKAAAAENLTAYKGLIQGLARIPAADRERVRQQILADPSSKWMPKEALEAARTAPLDDANMARYLQQVEEKIYEVSHGERLVGITPGRPAREAYVAPDKTEITKYQDGDSEVLYQSGGAPVRGLIPDAPQPAAPPVAGNTSVPVPASTAPAIRQPTVAPAAARPDTLAAAVNSLFPGAQVTSTMRSPEHNANVGGVPNSRHLTRGGAVDFVPPNGVSMAAAARQMEAKYGGRAIDEGDHVHWQPSEALRGGDIDDTLTGSSGVEVLQGGGQDSLAPAGRIIARGAPKPSTSGQMTPALQEQIRHNQVVERQAEARLRPGGKGLPADDRKYISAARSSAQQMQTMATDMQRFVELNKKVATGPNMAQRVFDRTLEPRFREMESIRDKLTPAMRQGLPGAASDRDVAMFQSATVGTDKYGSTNVSIANAARSYAKRQLDYVAYVEDYARRNGTILGAEEEWGVYAEANPLFGATKDGGLRVMPQEPWRKWFGVPAPNTRRGRQPSASKADPLGIR